MRPTISIIIPIYNQEQYLSRCIDSILEQTFTDFEVLCVDDKSTDSSYEIIDQYAKKDSRIIPLKNPGKGVSAARNFGIENARGEYIGFVDSDDFVQPQMYEFLYRAISENNCDMAVCGYESVREQESRFFEYKCKRCDTSDFLEINNRTEKTLAVLSVWSKLINKEQIDKIRFSENFKIGEDALFCSKIWIKANRVVYIDLPLYGYFKNEKSAIHTNDDKSYLDRLNGRWELYNTYKNYNRKTSIHFLLSEIKLITRLKTENLLIEKSNLRVVKKMWRKAFIPFLLVKEISIKEKFYYIVKYLFN